METIFGGEEIVERIWVPDTYIYNERSSEYKETFVSISSDGEVHWCRRVQLIVTEVWRNSSEFSINTISMLQHGQTFNLFPFDTQKFKLVFKGIRWMRKDIRYEWKYISINPLIDFHDFKLLGFRNNTVNFEVS